MSTVWRRVELNYGYVVVYANGYFDIHYNVPGYGADLEKVRVDDPNYGLLALASRIEDQAGNHEGTGKWYEELARRVREEGWCVAQCATKTWLYYPPPNACERAREACELWQGGFVRFISADELEDLASKRYELARRMREDAATLRALYEEAPKPPPYTPPPAPPPTPPPTPPPVTPPTATTLLSYILATTPLVVTIGVIVAESTKAWVRG